MVWVMFSLQAGLSITGPPSAVTPSTGGVNEHPEVGGFHDESSSVDDGSMTARTATILGGGGH